MELEHGNDVLSKKERKRLAKQEERERTRLEKRRRAEARAEAAKQQRRPESDFHEPASCLDAPTDRPEPTALDERRRVRVQARLEAENEFLARATSSCGIVIDCQYDNLMSDRERASLSTQIALSYAANRRCACPSILGLSSLSGPTAEALTRIGGFAEWRGVRTSSLPVDQLYTREQIVYLSADASGELETLDPTKVYVVGGLVDRNRHKGVSHARAVAMSVETARLPLSRYAVMPKGTTVLTVNQIVEILLELKCTGSWRQALLNVLPSRKQPDGAPADPACSEDDTGRSPSRLGRVPSRCEVAE
jgi:tRNA (guanine9-N1)-methyltransferase